jgi:membrane protein DedA with SNARE-associated domain
MVLHMQKYSLLYAVASLIYRPVCFYLGYLKHDLWVSLKLWTGCEVVAIFVYGYVAWKRMKARGA